MVYTLKVNGTTVDSTMVDNLSERILKAHVVLEGPKTQYQFYTVDSITQESYTRYGYSFAFHLTNKLDVKNIALVQAELTQMIAQKQSGKISVGYGQLTSNNIKHQRLTVDLSHLEAP